MQEIHYPSEAAARFATAVSAHLGEQVELPAAPPFGFYKTEIGRAYALAAAVIDGSMQHAPGVEWEDGTQFELPEQANPVRERLRDIARQLRHDDHFERSELPTAAAGLAGEVSEFYPEVGWSSNRDQCVLVAEAAAECVRFVGRDAGPDAAAELARNALEALAAADDIA